MKRKINLRLVGIATGAILITLIVSIFVFYDLYSSQVMNDIKSYTYLLDSSEIVLQYVEEAYNPKTSDLRITIIESNGTVEYDSSADASSMDNHSLRPEIHEAMETGEGHSIRKSDTLARNTYYYAVKLKDGRILRVAKEADNQWSFIRSIIPVAIGIFILLIVSCILVARYLTKSLLKPVNQAAMDLDHMDTVKTYDELKPFMDKIHSQHQDILKSAKMRQEFTANVSHELKTPLTSISGYSELIETGLAGEENVKHFASQIHKNANRLLMLINDILRLSQLDSMEEVPQMQKVDLTDVALSCVEMLQIHAEKHEVMITGKNLEGAVFVNANKSMMEELIYNLCDNAIRYNKVGGSVWVTTGYQADGRAYFEVKDNGIGISSEDQIRIFERFYRVDKSRSKATGGTGLGLAIVKHIVEQHNAELLMDSAIGSGTQIKVLFPLA